MTKFEAVPLTGAQTRVGLLFIGGIQTFLIGFAQNLRVASETSDVFKPLVVSPLVASPVSFGDLIGHLNYLHSIFKRILQRSPLNWNQTTTSSLQTDIDIVMDYNFHQLLHLNGVY